MSGKREPLIRKIKKEKEDEQKSVTKVIKPITKRSVTPQKVQKASEDEKGKIEVSDEGGSTSVDSEEAVIRKINMDKVDEPQSVTKVIKPNTKTSVTPQKVQKASEDEKGKIEVSDEGGGASVDSEEVVIYKINTDKVDEPQSVTKMIETDEGSSGTPKKTECADTQIDNMNKDDKDDKNVGTVAMNDLHKRMKKELD